MIRKYSAVYPSTKRRAKRILCRNQETYRLNSLHESKSSQAEIIMTPEELLCINTIRAVSADQPQAANSGHPGAPMGCAPFAFLLWTEFMNYSSKDPGWINRDRFVLSNGHACALQYTMLHLTGYGLTVKDLSEFRRLGSKTPGHPECFLTAGTSYTSCIHFVLGY
jgi:transketolase N-terminal domain/subunit